MNSEYIYKILNKNMNNLNRLDIVVRYMYIEYFFSKNVIGKKIYEKMQRKRVPYLFGQQNFSLKFDETIQSFKDYGLKKGSKIILNKHLELIDGSHRLACCLFFDLLDRKIEFSVENKKVVYNLDWFQKNFTDDELEIIKKKYYKIINSILCYG